MMAMVVAVFFVAGAALAWLVLFPDARDGVLAGVDRLWSRLGGLAGRWQSRAGSRVEASRRRMQDGRSRLSALLSRHRMPLVIGLLLLTIPPLLVLQARRQVLLDTFDAGTAGRTDTHVLALLRGERLVPPADLPPAVFATAEAVRVMPGIATADRKWDRLDPDFQQRLLAVFQVMRDEHGYELALVEGYRSPERQARLAAQGSSVTLAGAGRSWHQYGLAADVAPVRGGKLQWDMNDPWTRRGYHLYGEVARSVGLVWGGGWKSIQDYGHVELRRAGVRPPA